MKILFLSRLYYPHIGGVEKHVKSLTTELIKRGYCVSLVTEMFDEALKTRDFVDGLEIFRFAYPKIKFLGILYIWYFLFRNRRLIGDSDIVHCHDVFVWYLPFRFIYFKKPVYTTFHGWEGVYPIPIKNVLIRKIANYLSFATLGVGKYIEKYYGVSLAEITYGAVVIKGRHLLRKLQRRIVYVGRLEKDTGLQIFFKVLPYLKDYRVDFYGDGQLSGMCEKYGRVHGFVRNVPYQKFSICFASGYLTVLEAMSTKCLVVVCYDNSLKRYCWNETPFAKWIIIGKNPRKLADRIKYCLEYPNKSRFMINSAYGWVKNQTWKNMADLYIRLWKV